MRFDASNAWVESNVESASPIPSSLTGSSMSHSDLEQTSQSSQSGDDMLVDGCFQGIDQILNIRYSP